MAEVEVEVPEPEKIHEHSRDSFSRGVALITALYAVVLAIAALGGNYAMKEMILNQQKASDQWAFYQAKVIREHQYRGQKLRAEADLLERGDSMKPAAREKLETLMKKFDEEEKRYSDEKLDIEKEAKKLEHERDHYQTRDPYFLIAEALLQIAIVMASVSILARSRPIFAFSVALALAGVLLTANGYFFFFELPSLRAGH